MPFPYGGAIWFSHGVDIWEHYLIIIINISLLSLLSYVHKYYYFYKLYIACIRNSNSLIYIDMGVVFR